MKTTSVQLGYDFAKGAIRYIANVIVTIALLSVVIWYIMGRYDMSTDDSDQDGFHRSNLRVHRDAKTGVEYLSDGRGGLILRAPRP